MVVPCHGACCVQMVGQMSELQNRVEAMEYLRREIQRFRQEKEEAEDEAGRMLKVRACLHACMLFCSTIRFVTGLGWSAVMARCCMPPD